MDQTNGNIEKKSFDFSKMGVMDGTQETAAFCHRCHCNCNGCNCNCNACHRACHHCHHCHR